MSEEITKLPDQITKFMFEDAPVRGAVVQLEDQWQEMTQFQNYPASVNKMLGEFTAGALLLSSTIKFDGSLIVQVKGSGPVSMVVVEVKNRTTVRAMAKLREDAKIADNSSFQDLINADAEGQCAIILDPANRRPSDQPYMGVVPLVGDSIAAILENYMEQSEQLPTKISLASTSKIIGGLLVQKMPEDGGTANKDMDKDAGPRISQIAGTLKEDELLTLGQDVILRRLFWQEKIQLLGTEEIQFQCGCSKEKTDAMLKSLGKKELEDILKAEGKVEVTCQFCNKTITYSPADIEALFLEDSPMTVSKEDVPSTRQ